MRRFKAVSILVVLAASGLVFAAEDGKALYDSKCASCHGKDGVAKPMGKGSRNFNDPAYAAESVESITKVTSEGKGKMPAYKDKLTAEQLSAVVAHVKTLAPAK
jgi:cytochrome c6